jgi:hypothetical protein
MEPCSTTTPSLCRKYSNYRKDGRVSKLGYIYKNSIILVLVNGKKTSSNTEYPDAALFYIIFNTIGALLITILLKVSIGPLRRFIICYEFEGTPHE